MTVVSNVLAIIMYYCGTANGVPACYEIGACGRT